jgi:SAM-dependent methyltransferase
MPFTLDQVVPWGRSFDEYVAMFRLTADDLEKGILGCGDGPASFNAMMRQRGKSVVSVDPLYDFSAEQIRQRVDLVYGTIMEQLSANQASYVWTTITSPEHLGQVRMEAMTVFLEDYERGKREGRYLPHELPDLPFGDQKFDLCLCSHLLFTYSDRLSSDFHEKAVLEMCRVAKEVRVFPLLDMSGKPSPHLDPVSDCLSQHGHVWDIEKVGYNFQCGSNQMLRVANEDGRQQS